MAVATITVNASRLELCHELADEIVAYNIERHKPRTPKEEFELWFNTSS